MKRMTKLGTLTTCLVFAAALATGGCGFREHTRDNHGKNTRAFFSAQQAKAKQGKTTGLDSEEAALVHKSYRKVLDPSGGEAPPESKVLIVDGDSLPGARRSRGRK